MNEGNRAWLALKSMLSNRGLCIKAKKCIWRSNCTNGSVRSRGMGYEKYWYKESECSWVFSVRRSQLLKIKAQMSSTWATGCVSMTVCVWYLTWLLLISGGRKSWYIIIINNNNLAYIFFFCLGENRRSRSYDWGRAAGTRHSSYQRLP